MSEKHLFAKNLMCNDVMPLLVGWFSEHGYEVNTVANRIDAIMGNVTLSFLIEDFGKGCTIRMSGPPEHIQKVVSYVSQISELGFETAPCDYCKVSFPKNQVQCPNCGAFRKTKNMRV